jgi:hypothetical protein
MRMAAMVLSEIREYVQVLEAKPEVERHAAAKLGGAIAAGILVGAVAAFLVGGIAGCIRDDDESRAGWFQLDLTAMS